MRLARDHLVVEDLGAAGGLALEVVARAHCSSMTASMVACSSESRRDDRAVVLHEHDALVAERVGHRQVRLVRRRRSTWPARRGTAPTTTLYMPTVATGRRQHRHVVRVQVHDRVDVGPQLVDAGVEVDRGREARARRRAAARSKPSLADAVGRGLVEVLEAGDPERVVLAVGAGADVAADVASRSPRGRGCAARRRCGTGCRRRPRSVSRASSVRVGVGLHGRRAPGGRTAATRSPT